MLDPQPSNHQIHQPRHCGHGSLLITIKFVNWGTLKRKTAKVSTFCHNQEAKVVTA
ncbi:hypothetical protein F441_17891 [Phytophthora nicotianae CJ01A1]|uniref:Uncharacterized protein n=4 Tax=Phytophthora nicotianae TaxID=4792 RepID=W2R0I4_PHYN3|nr:hypothetical protein PPTG_21620 [Phytophthora nicotianae INRA-310]ETI35705.1 hypothetical protein F443_18021 [Phytophthora nicotianae P1569]ETN18947.1 hypothetical protein PPTG_21620 [Phytophthora nicotianae INRA-310]ETP05527.1 hypothetical protein F441_17891 [Phytophthora nicotianae CJ01A1]ETP33646.1 hypothetical protein F442_17860 [Phytophthora nicotianae P10297]